MQSKIFIFVVCALLVVTSATTQVSADCKVDNVCLQCTTDTPPVCNKCADGYYVDKGTCTPCPEANKCKTCKDASTCATCADGFYLDNGACKACSKDNSCKTCTTADTCTACADGFYLDGIKCTACPTLTNCKTCKDDKTCATCADSYYLDGKGKCATCNVTILNCATCSADGTNPAKCTTCAKGFKVDKDGKCVKDGHNDLAAYSVTYFVTFALLLMTAAIVAQFA